MAEPPKKIGKSILVTDSLTQAQERVINDIFAEPPPKPPDKIIYRGHIYVRYGETSLTNPETLKYPLNLDLLAGTHLTHHKV